MKTFRLIGITIIIILTSVTFTACKDGNSNEPVNPTPNETPTITIDPSIITNGLVFAAEGNEKSITFTTNTNWTLNIAPTTSGSTWCTASATNGNKGEATVRFTTTKNDDYDDRSIAVTIKAGTASKTFTITQKCKEAILLTAKKFEVNQIGGSIDVEVKSNIDYQMEISETAKSWITQTNTRALSTHNYTFNIATNEEHDKREGEIFFKKGDYEETVTVYQSGGALVMLTKDEYTVSDKGETITVEIKSNIEYGVKMPQVDWIYDEASTRGASSHTLKYIISPNESYDSRSAQIVYYDKNDETNADTLTITQMQKDAIVIAKNEYIIGAKEETIEVELSSNIDYTISIADDGKNWISRTENTRTMTADKVNFKIAENTFDNSRTSYITFTSDNGVSQKIKIFQQGAGAVIHVEVAGTLSRLINSSSKDTITNLKIIGNLKSTDIEFLRNMKKIQVLDLSEVNIPKLGNYAFESSNITSIILPNGLTSIGEGTFWHCTRLASISIPNSVTSIGYCAFFENYKLISITIPNSVTSIDDKAFLFSTNLTAIDVDKNNIKYSSIDGVLYDKDISTLIKCPEGKASIIIPSRVTSIADKAFHLCPKLTSINVSKDNTKYSSIDDVLYDKNTSTLIKCPEGKTTITIPSNVTSIEDKAFVDSKISSIVIPNSVTNIGNEAFKNSSLTSITIPNSVTNIGNRAFASTNFTSVIIPNSVTSIKDGTFSNCGNLTSITIPNSVTSIGEEAFSTCRHLNSIIIPNSVTSIGSLAFEWCSSLKSIVISNSVQKIGEYAFWGCSSLTSVTIPNGVISIENGVFSSCANLSSITIPNSVTSIGDYVFWGCINLKEIHLKHESPQNINPSIFEDITVGQCILYVPRGCKNTYSNVFGWTWFQDIIEE